MDLSSERPGLATRLRRRLVIGSLLRALCNTLLSGMREPTSPFTKEGAMVITPGVWLSRGSWISKFSIRMASSRRVIAVKNAANVRGSMSQSSSRKLVGWARTCEVVVEAVAFGHLV